MKATPISPLLPTQQEHVDQRGVLWRTIPHRPVIRVSSLGEVERLDRRGGSYTGNWKPRHPKVVKGYYVIIGLQKITTSFVHRLVAHAFFGEKSWMRSVTHMNGDKLDNRVENLCIKSNTASSKPFLGSEHQRSHHTPDKGADGRFLPSRKEKKKKVRPSLDDRDAQRLIDEWFAFKYETYKDLGKAFGITEIAANSLVLGATRPYLERPPNRIRYQPRRYSVKTIMAMVAAWEAGSFKTKKELAAAFGIPRHFACRLLNGKASPRLPRLSHRVGFKSWRSLRTSDNAKSSLP